MNLRKVNLNFNISKIISVYPNPVKNILHVDISEYDELLANIQIFDVSARLVFSSNFSNKLGENTFNIDVSNLENGVYQIKIINDNKLIYNKSFVKTKMKIFFLYQFSFVLNYILKFLMNLYMILQIHQVP